MSSTLQDNTLNELFYSAIGDGFAGKAGCYMTEWSEGFAKVELEVKPEHLNRGGSVHGGVLATLIDVAGAMAGLFSDNITEQRLAVTLSLNISYTGRVNTGKLIAIGKVKYAGHKVFFSRTEVFDDHGNSIAHGDAVNKYKPKSSRS